MQTKTKVSENGVPVQETLTETAPHSLELSCNAKGQYSWSIKIYFKDEDKENAIGIIAKLNDGMLQKFPNIDDTAKLKDLDTKAQGKK
jgi:hypothetical protein